MDASTRQAKYKEVAMQQPAQPISLRAAEQSPAGDTPSLYLVDGTSGCAAHSALPSGALHPRCLVYLVPMKPTKVRSTRERRLQLRDSLLAGGASHNASVLAKDPHFWDYLQQINLAAYDGEVDARRARHFINQVCGVTGRHALAYDTAPAQRFYSFVQQPFLDWLLSDGSA